MTLLKKAFFTAESAEGAEFFSGPANSPCSPRSPRFVFSVDSTNYLKEYA